MDVTHARLLGARDGIVSGMLAVRRERGALLMRLRSVPAHHVRVRARLQEQIDLLTRIDGQLDLQRLECLDERNFRKSVEIVSPYRP